MFGIFKNAGTGGDPTNIAAVPYDSEEDEVKASRTQEAVPGLPADEEYATSGVTAKDVAHLTKEFHFSGVGGNKLQHMTTTQIRAENGNYLWPDIVKAGIDAVEVPFPLQMIDIAARSRTFNLIFEQTAKMSYFADLTGPLVIKIDHRSICDSMGLSFPKGRYHIAPLEIRVDGYSNPFKQAIRVKLCTPLVSTDVGGLSSSMKTRKWSNVANTASSCTSETRGPVLLPTEGMGHSSRRETMYVANMVRLQTPEWCRFGGVDFNEILRDLAMRRSADGQDFLVPMPANTAVSVNNVVQWIVMRNHHLFRIRASDSDMHGPTYNGDEPITHQKATGKLVARVPIRPMTEWINSHMARQNDKATLADMSDGVKLDVQIESKDGWSSVSDTIKERRSMGLPEELADPTVRLYVKVAMVACIITDRPRINIEADE